MQAAGSAVPLDVEGTALPEDFAPVGLDFVGENLPRLAAMAVPRARAGERIPVDLIWQWPAGAHAGDPAQEPVAFVHLLGPVRADGGIVWSGDDRHVLAGSGEAPGGVLVRHMLEVPADIPPGRYELEIGLYDQASGARFGVRRVSDRRAGAEVKPNGTVVTAAAGYTVEPGGDRLVVPGIEVAPPR
jgi:hypothetical protein